MVSRCALATKVIRSRESTPDTQRQLQPSLLRFVSDDFPILHLIRSSVFDWRLFTLSDFLDLRANELLEAHRRQAQRVRDIVLANRRSRR